jgi:radical SAM protein with 4Fe4S-binding SPASM domain
LKEYTYKILTKVLSRYFKTPQYLILFVTDKCWMKCKHCWFNEEWKKNNLSGESLSFYELEKLSKSIKKTLFLSITGGEAFIREDIEDIVKLFTKKKKVQRYQIPTSGFESSLILEKTYRILNANPTIPFRIDVSLDGNKETHDKIRGVKCAYENAVTTIKELNKLKSKYKFFDVGVITTISGYNQYIIEEISEIIESIHPEGEWMINLIRGKTRDSASEEIKLDNYIKAHTIIRNRIKSHTYKGHSGHISAKWLTAKNSVRRKTITKIYENNYKGGGCSAGSLGGVIFNDGSVYPCELINKSIGNLRDFDFNLPELWNSKNADNIRNWIQDNRCICTQECFLSINFLIQPNLWPSIIYERFKLLKK